MAKMEIDCDYFYKSLLQFPYIDKTDKYGLQEESINIIKIKPDNSILDLLVFNRCGICFLRSKFNNAIENYDKFLLTVKNIAVSLFSFVNDKSSFAFKRIFFGKYKLTFLFKGDLAFVGLFKANCDKSFQKLLLMHLFVALINFKGDTLEKVVYLYEQNNKKVFDSIQSYLTRTKEDSHEFKTTDLFEYLIYEKYFLRYMCIHFQKLWEIIFKPEDIHFSYIKFKNMYLVDIQSKEILFDWLKLHNSKKRINYYLNEKLWDELMYHSKQMMEYYTNDHRLLFSNTDSSYRFVKFECTSSFPRVSFIIKFLPILKGLACIHVYSQKKLSRISDNEQQLQKGYREIDLLFGSEVKTTTNLDLRYTEPKKLLQIEKFLIEFLISIRSNDIFKDSTQLKVLKYFNYNIISSINSVPNANDSGNLTIEVLLQKINMTLHEMYNMIKQGKNYDKTISVNSKLFAEIEKMDNLLIIKEEDILKDLFDKKGINDNPSHERNKTKKQTDSPQNIIPSSLEDSLELSRIEKPLNCNISIDQSEDMSVICLKINQPKKLINKQINLEKLVDMSSVMMTSLYSENGGNDEIIMKGKTSKSPNSKTKNHKDSLRQQMNIKVPNPKEEMKSPQMIKNPQKLILLDEKENNVPSTLRELIPNVKSKSNGKYDKLV